MDKRIVIHIEGNIDAEIIHKIKELFNGTDTQAYIHSVVSMPPVPFTPSEIIDNEDDEPLNSV